MWLDSILNFCIPIIVIIAMLWILYKMFLPMFHGLGGAIGGLWEKVKGEEPENQRIKNITYE